MVDDTLLPATVGIGGDYPTSSNELPGRIITSRPDEARKRAAAQVAKIALQQAEREDDDER